MLHLETIEPGTFSVLKRLMNIPSLQKFSLVRGTALSLRFGHRTSVDIDLFYHEKFEIGSVEKSLRKEFGNAFEYEGLNKQFGIFCFTEKVKVDIVRFPHLPISEMETEDGIRMYSNADIAAMKIQAILGRAQKKDFWDLHELLHLYSLQQIINWHKQKYPNQMLAISIPNAITYFADAEESDEPKSLKEQTWEGVKKSIQKKVSDFLK